MSVDVFSADFVKLYLDQRPGLLKRVARRLGSQSLAADLVHDVFMRRWEKRDQTFDDEAAYIGRSINNAIVDYLRAERTRREFSEAILPEQFSTPTPTPLDVCESRDAVRQLDNWLDTLPDRTRHIFLLNKVHGCTYSEIAGVLNISRSAVEKHIARAMIACTFQDDF